MLRMQNIQMPSGIRSQEGRQPGYMAIAMWIKRVKEDTPVSAPGTCLALDLFQPGNDKCQR